MGPYFPAAATDADAYQFVHVFALYFPVDALRATLHAQPYIRAATARDRRRSSRYRPSAPRVAYHTVIPHGSPRGVGAYIINSYKERSNPNALLF